MTYDTDVIELALTQGKVALVDAVDADLVTGYSWSAWWNGHTWYAHTAVILVPGRTTTLRMHRLIMGCTPRDGRNVDHQNGDGLDNRRGNLRFASTSQNLANGPSRRGSSQYRGVCFDKSRERWAAGVKVNGRRVNLGRFDSEVDAAMAYDRAALKAFGTFAHVNFPGVQS